MNERENITKYFSERLIRLLIKNGYVSRSASTGVKVKELSENACCSFEMARRYTNGNALPDALAIKKIARWLDVDPGWLLYGNHQEQNITDDDPLVLTKADFKLLFERIIPVYFSQKTASHEDIIQLHDFFSDVIADFCRLHASLDVKLKILEASIASALHFLPKVNKKLAAE